MKQIDTIFQKDYEKSYKENNYKENNTSKCSPGKKCPCRLWVNCSQYVDITEQQNRLKRKLEMNNHDEDIKLWYTENFRIIYDMPSSIPNG